MNKSKQLNFQNTLF